MLKKKQRGIILKHEQERNEIKKLKQMQKVASEERKTVLKQQRSLIKTHLSTANMLSKIKTPNSRSRRSSGPLRVVQTESVRSETSLSRKSSGVEEILNITSSRSQSVRVSEEFDSDTSIASVENREKVPVSNVKRYVVIIFLIIL